MGTHADFYVLNDDKLEWLGSVAFDGYPAATKTSCGVPWTITRAKSKKQYISAINDWFAENKSKATFPKDGWPWHWVDSYNTDFAYVFFDGKCHFSIANVFVPVTKYGKLEITNIHDIIANASKKNIRFPRMRMIKTKVNIAYGKFGFPF